MPLYINYFNTIKFKNFYSILTNEFSDIILATFLGSLIPVSGHCISSQLIGTIGVLEARLHDAAAALAVAIK